MSLVLLPRLVSRHWRRPVLISLRIINRPSIRNISQSVVSRRDSSQSGLKLSDAFTPEANKSYTELKNRLSHRDAAIEYRDMGLGPLSALDICVQEALSQPNSKPAEVLSQSVAGGTVSPHVIRLCLEAQRNRVINIPRKIRYKVLDVQKGDGLARAVLTAIWEDEKLWAPLVMYDAHTLFNLCYYAILEDLTDFVVEWAFVRITDETSLLAGSGHHNVWRGHLLGELIEAEAQHCTSQSADTVLTCMFQIIDKWETNRSTPNIDPSCVSLRPVGLRCESILCNKIGGGTNAALFDKFVNWWTSLSDTRDQFSSARLQMHHPHTPTEAPALEFLRTWDHHDAPYKSPKQKQRYDRFLQRTIDLAMKNHNPEGAAWLRETFKDRIDPSTGRFAPPTNRDLAEARLERLKSPKKDLPAGQRARPLVRYQSSNAILERNR